MTRTLKALGLATVAALLIGAMAASAAQAEKYTAPQYPASITGKQTTTHVLTLNGGRKFQCTTVNVAGTLTEASEELKTTSESAGCSMNILGSNSANTTVSCAGTYEHISLLVATKTVCSEKYTHHVAAYEDAGMTKPLCVYNIEDLGSFKGLTNENLGGTSGVKTTYNLSGIPYKLISGSGLLCGPESSTATYTGTSTFTAKNKLAEPIAFDIG